jgi:hypothetical protein
MTFSSGVRALFYLVAASVVSTGAGMFISSAASFWPPQFIPIEEAYRLQGRTYLTVRGSSAFASRYHLGPIDHRFSNELDGGNLPAWVRSAVTTHASADVINMYVFGWPFRSCGYTSALYCVPGRPSTLRESGVFDVSWRKRRIRVAAGVLYSGLLLNTAIATVILASLGVIYRHCVGVRRQRQGRCVHCGYDVAGARRTRLAACPECGREVAADRVSAA